MNLSPSHELRKDWKRRPQYGRRMVTAPSDIHYGKLRLGIILAPMGETISPVVLNFAAYVAGFPRARKAALAGGKHLGRRRILSELCDCPGTMAIDTSRFLSRVRAFHWCGPGQDEFPRNSLLLRWLAENVRRELQAPYGKHQRHLVLWTQLPLLPPGMSIENVQLREVLYVLGRVAENYADFVAIHRKGRLDFLKFRSGPTFPEGSWKI